MQLLKKYDKPNFRQAYFSNSLHIIDNIGRNYYSQNTKGIRIAPTPHKTKILLLLSS